MRCCSRDEQKLQDLAEIIPLTLEQLTAKGPEASVSLLHFFLTTNQKSIAEGWEKLSQKRILKALTGLGLSQIDAEVYMYLAEKGPQKTRRIVEELNLRESLFNSIIESLTTKGIVYSTDKNVHLHYALPFEKALELLVNGHLKKAQIIDQNRDEILVKWRNLLKNSTKT